MNDETKVLPPAEAGAATSGETETASASEASTEKTTSKPKAKTARKRKAAPKRKPRVRGAGGVFVGETPPLHVLHRMAVETSRTLAKEHNGNARQRASRRRHAKAV